MFETEATLNTHRRYRGTVPDEAYGIEVEVEGVDQYYNEDTDRHEWAVYPPQGWDVKSDGSLRDGGAEFVSEPLGFSDAVVAVRRLWHLRDDEGWSYGARCGVHVHINMRSLTPAQIATGLCLYAATEPAWFDLCGPDREQNIYCIPWYRAEGEVDLVVEALEGEGEFGQTCKYTALYTEPLVRFGTVEFRGAPVFERFEQMKRLLCMCRGLYRYATYGSIEQVMEWGGSEWGQRQLLSHAGFAGNRERVLEEMHRLDTFNIAAKFVRTNQPLDWSF